MKLSISTNLIKSIFLGFMMLVSTVSHADIDPEIMRRVDPEFKSFVKAYEKPGQNFQSFNAENLAQQRGMVATYTQPVLNDVPFEKVEIPIGSGKKHVVAYLINADKQHVRPAILHTHGGGFVMGSAESMIRPMQELAKALDCAVLTVEYTLAPEATYRVSVEENYQALKWLHNNAQRLGVDANKIALYGESAGGGHAALLAITARDRGEVPVALQVLLYPMLDDRTGSSVRLPHYLENIMWTAESNRFGWASFLGQAPGTEAVSESAVPSRTQSLERLPPTFIAVGTLDLFVLEDITYAKRLIEAGVETELHVYQGVYHGFNNVNPDATISKDFRKAELDAFKKAFR